MILPTEDMVRRARNLIDEGVSSESVRDALAAVLTIFEREVLQPAVDQAEYRGHVRGWKERGERDRKLAAGDVHEYLSTSCLHGRHEYCAAMIGLSGAKRPAQCKFCEAGCVCACHEERGKRGTV